ncbi:MAG: sensor histidine kinase [Oscillospiraceae bacterium]|nr:sensor histidine kinase [Oscillospiraceae bacterium]
MRELSLNVLDVAQNCITAGASLIEISVEEDTSAASLVITISDDGKGMSPEQAKNAADPFYTTRTTRDVGLGLPFFKMSCEMTAGSFSIVSAPGQGTTVTASYNTGHIDMVPIGDMSETILLLIYGSPHLDFLYSRTRDGAGYTLDTRQIRGVLGGDVPLNDNDVAQWLREYLAEQESENLS